jgi:hypothetical protein
VKDPQLALSFAAHRANSEGKSMIIWHNSLDQGFGRFAIRPSDGIPPRTFDARGRRISWSIWTVVSPGEPATASVDDRTRP